MRLAAVQEELLSTRRGTQVPVIWATQMLEELHEDRGPARAR